MTTDTRHILEHCCVEYLSTGYIVKMASCEQNFCSCVINIGILLHNKLLKGNGIMKHIMSVFIYLHK